METLPELLTSHLYLMITPHDSARKTMAEVIARLALRGPLSVMDGGNLFDPYRVARQVRRQTHELDSALERISLRRAFTCYQMAVLLAKAPAGAQPQVALGLMTTFYDENVAAGESRRLLGTCLTHLGRLSRLAPVVVSASPPRAEQGEQMALWNMLLEAIDNVLAPQPPASQPVLRLF
jgi:hypothetical protein